MDSNQYSPKFTNSSSCWNIEKIDMTHVHMLQNQIASSFDRSLWSNYPIQTHQIPSSSSSSSSNQNMPSSSLLGDMLAHFEEDVEPEEELGAMKEMMYKIAAMQPVDIDPATIRKPKRRNVRISDDPQSVAARHRRERISEKIRILQRLVPGGTKMDTASMLDEAVRYVKFLKRQIRLLQSNQLHPQPQQSSLGIGINDNHATTAAAGCLSTAPDHWPFAPHSKPRTAPTNSPSVQETMVAVGGGYSIGGHASSDALQGFNHEVISD